jgi:hypothetical protein
MKYKAVYCNEKKLIKCKPLNKDCEQIVTDLVNSAQVTQHWSKEKKQQYFHRAVSIACDMAARKPRSKFKKLIDKIADKFFCLVSRLVIYVP